jgi:hypothetical protein
VEDDVWVITEEEIAVYKGQLSSAKAETMIGEKEGSNREEKEALMLLSEVR